jgi:hypothetical protein
MNFAICWAWLQGGGREAAVSSWNSDAAAGKRKWLLYTNL